MRTVSKHTLDELLRVQRKYAKTGDTDLLGKKNTLAKTLSEQAFDDDKYWLSFADFTSSLVGVYPLLKSRTNQQVYDILKIVGIEVVDDE